MDSKESTPQEVLGDRAGVRAWVEYLLYRGAVGAIAHLPVAGQRALVVATARLAMALDTRRSVFAERFIRQALGPRAEPSIIEELVRGSWRHFVQVVVEDASYNRRVLGKGLRDHYDVELSDAARRALEGGAGGFLVTPHVGMWEAGPPIMAALGFQPLSVVSRPPRNRPLSRFARDSRECRGYRLVHRNGAIAGVTAAIEAGGWVGLMLDQRAHGKTIVAPFFGRQAKCERTIPVLVKRLKRPVVFGACYRTDRPFHYRMAVDQVLWPEELTSLDAGTIASTINRAMERMILRAPEQYLWLHDRYRGAPPPAEVTGPPADSSR